MYRNKAFKYKTKRRSNGYYKKNDRSFYSKQLKKIIICIIIVLCVIILKKIDTDTTQRAVELVDNTVKYNYDIKENKNKVLAFFGKLKKNKGISVFKNVTDSTIDEVLRPVEGKVYRKFGKVEKSSGVIINNNGIDIKPYKKEVVAVKEGLVDYEGFENNKGYYVIVDHGDMRTKYQKMKLASVKKGDKLSKGDKIGTVDVDKNSVLHFEVWKNGVAVDPVLELYSNKY